MLKPGARNLITDVDGILVGNAEDTLRRTGATVLLGADRLTAACDVRGGAPGTRDTEALQPQGQVDQIDGIALSGGSVYGLDTASGVISLLREKGHGFQVAGIRVPIVPGAILFDLLNGGDKDWGDEPPYCSLGRAAAEASGETFPLGNVGAGFGAMAGRIKGGLGSASAVTGDGLQVGALVAVNSVGAVVMPGRPQFWAWPFEMGDEFGGLPAPGKPEQAGKEPEIPFESRLGLHARGGTNTTLAIVATNAGFDKAGAARVATMAHDGLARAIRPIHTPFDGDTIFAVSTGRIALEEPIAVTQARVGALAADCLARAVARGVFCAEDLGDVASYRSAYGMQKGGSPRGGGKQER